MFIKDGTRVAQIIASCCSYSSAFLMFLEDAAKPASNPTVFFRKTGFVSMLVVFKPSSLDRFDLFDDGI